MHKPSTQDHRSESDDAAVAEALRELDALDGAPVHEHPPVIDRVHQALQDRLDESLPEPGAQPG